MFSSKLEEVGIILVGENLEKFKEGLALESLDSRDVEEGVEVEDLWGLNVPGDKSLSRFLGGGELRRLKREEQLLLQVRDKFTEKV